MAKTPEEILEGLLTFPVQRFSPMREGVVTKPGAITERELERRMYYTRPDEERARRHHAVQEAAYEFGLVISRSCPNPSRELSIALTKLEEARMWANAAIAHQQADEAVTATARPTEALAISSGEEG